MPDRNNSAVNGSAARAAHEPILARAASRIQFLAVSTLWMANSMRTRGVANDVMRSNRAISGRPCERTVEITAEADAVVLLAGGIMSYRGRGVVERWHEVLRAHGER